MGLERKPLDRFAACATVIPVYVLRAESCAKPMVSFSPFRVLKIIVTLALIGLLPTGCGDPCRDCRNIACPGSAKDCSRNDMECGDAKYSNTAECELRR